MYTTVLYTVSHTTILYTVSHTTILYTVSHTTILYTVSHTTILYTVLYTTILYTVSHCTQCHSLTTSDIAGPALLKCLLCPATKIRTIIYSNRTVKYSSYSSQHAKIVLYQLIKSSYGTAHSKSCSYSNYMKKIL